MFAQLSFDGNISLGPILSALGIITTILGVSHALIGRLVKGEFNLQMLRQDFAEIKPKVDMILVHQQQLVDGNERMNRVEDRINKIELSLVKNAKS